MLFVDNPDFVWGLIASMYTGNVLLLMLNYPMVGLFANVLRIPARIFAPFILIFCILGAYTVNNSVMDIQLMVIFGLLGYVMRKGEPGVMLVGEELWTALPKTVAVLRDKVVVAYAYDKVARIALEHAKGAVTIERDGSGWKLTAPEPLKADAGAVNALLWRIRDLRASGFLGEEAKDVTRYLSKPEVTVRIWEEGAKEPKVLLLGASHEVRGGQPAAVAAMEGQGPVMLVEAKALEDLARTAADLRDKSLLPAFELGDVKRARVAGGGKSLLIERKGEAEWKVLEPSKGSAKDAKVSDLLLTLKALRWKEIASATGDDAARFGLDRPELEVTLSRADGAELATLLLGKEEGERTYARVKASPAIYVIDSKRARDLRKAPLDVPG